MKDIVAEWERAASGFTKVENPDFACCVNQWLERKKLTIRPNTLESYKVEAKAHLIPVLGRSVSVTLRDKISKSIMSDY